MMTEMKPPACYAVIDENEMTYIRCRRTGILCWATTARCPSTAAAA